MSSTTAADRAQRAEHCPSLGLSQKGRLALGGDLRGCHGRDVGAGGVKGGKVAAVMPEADGAGRVARVLRGPSGAACTVGGITLGVEEEFVLLDPFSGAAVPVGGDLVRMLDGEPGVQQELMQFQVETGTSVCTSLDGSGNDLVRLRRLVAAAAARLGCRLVASGTAPFRTPGLAVTGQPRYQELARHYGPLLIDSGGTCGCHVHVGVPSRDLGVQVLARLRPWLASLLATRLTHPSRAATTRPGEAGGTRSGHAGRRRRRLPCGPTPLPTMRRSAASSTRARRSTSKGFTCSRGFPHNRTMSR